MDLFFFYHCRECRLKLLFVYTNGDDDGDDASAYIWWLRGEKAHNTLCVDL